jgi:type II secretory pathway component PulF
MLAIHLTKGLKLAEALEQVPRYLPGRVVGILKAGQDIGDLRRVLPAARRALSDSNSQTRSAFNYLVILLFVCTPLTPYFACILGYFVIPKFKYIAMDLGMPVPVLTQAIFDSMPGLAILFSIPAILCIVGAILHMGGPRFRRWLQFGLFPVFDWFEWQFSWCRKRLIRDFTGIAALLLDYGMPEEQAITLAAKSMDNACFQERVASVTERLREGVSLVEAVKRIEPSGEFQWRLSNAIHGGIGFAPAMEGWLDVLEARAFAEEQAFSQTLTTGLVVLQGCMIGGLTVAVFTMLYEIVNVGLLW